MYKEEAHCFYAVVLFGPPHLVQACSTHHTEGRKSKGAQMLASHTIAIA
jgi:hypothetical protein